MASERTTRDSETPSKAGRVLGAIVLLLILAGGAGAWYFWHSQAEASDQSSDPNAPPVAVIHLDSFIVNLADQGQVTYLRASMDLGVDKRPDTKEGGKSIPLAIIRDTIIGVLSTRHSEELLTTDGKQKLKQDLIAALSNRVPGLGVRDIYFTDFLVQR
ncbi:MAG TPA: flagellar basal body-associated FliL family protein [Candidatus Baltobacteraceae bacterium]|nr:flagellar basal body-associated FliL family protein [Candidatus Baltobacteraceae bacterium]